jgi:FKBP-type peptidyl-prolyl cis-trans isomerase FkpA
LKYVKAVDGSEYKIYKALNGAVIKNGSFFQMNVIALYNDSLLFSSLQDGMPQYAKYDTAIFPNPYKQAFANLHAGDSVVVRVPADSLIAKGQAQDAPFIKQGQFIYQTYTVTNVYATQAQADSAQKTHVKVAKEIAYKKQMGAIAADLIKNKEQIENDSKIIEAFLIKNNIKYIKANWGTYLVIKVNGTGEKIGKNDIASVNYTGKSFSNNKVFDSNTDPKFKHVQPLDVMMNEVGNIALGWTDALLEMKRGTKATIYLPSSLGYGKNGNPQAGINPNEILVFDMNVVKVTTEAKMMAGEVVEEEVRKKIGAVKSEDKLKKAPVKPKTKTGKIITTTKKAVK